MILLLLFVLFIQIQSSYQTDCAILNSILEVPSTGCNLPFNQNQVYVVDKLILNGELTINRHIHLQYKQMVINAGAAMNLYSNFEKIVIEDIGNDVCDKQASNVGSITMSLQSLAQNPTYNIYLINNNNMELTLKDTPLGLFHGVKILISSVSGKTEYAEVDKVVGKTIFLKEKLKNSHQPWQIAAYGLIDAYPQLIILDEQRIVFKRNCLRIIPKKPQSSTVNTGALFQDMKGLSYENQDKNNIIELDQSIFINSDGFTNSFYQITGRFSDLIFINVNKLTITDQTKFSGFPKLNFYRMRSAEVTINSEKIKENIHDSSIYSDCSMKFILNGKSLYKINNSQFINCEFTISNSVDYNLNLLNLKIINTVFKTEVSSVQLLDMQLCSIQGKELNFLNFIIQQANILSCAFNGKGLSYAILLPNLETLKESQSLITLKVESSHFINFEDKGYPLITTDQKSDGYQELVLMYSMVYYEVSLFLNFYNILPSSNQKVIFLPQSYIWYQDNQNKGTYLALPLDKEQFKNSMFRRINPETSVIYHKPLFLFSYYIGAIYFDLGNVQGYHIQAVTQEFTEKWSIRNPYYLMENTLYSAYFKETSTGELAPAPSFLGMRIYQSDSDAFNNIPQIKLYFKSTVPIKSIKIRFNNQDVSSSKYVFISPIDGSLNISPQAKSDFRDIEISLAITSCQEGQFLQNGQCVSSCDPGLYPLNNICLDGSAKNYYYFQDNQYSPCLKGLNSSCQTCTTDKDCSACILPQLSASNLCQAEEFQKIYVKQGITYSFQNCLENCSSCSDLVTCNTCIDGYALSSDQKKCEICPKGSFIQDEQCIKCDDSLNCLECFSNISNGCRECKPGFILNQGVCTKECGSNQYLDSDGTCQDCDISCQGCNKFGCTRCTDGMVIKVTYNGQQAYKSCIQSTCTSLQIINSNNVCQNCFDQTNQKGCFDFYPHSILPDPGQYVELFISGYHSCNSSCKECLYSADNCTKCNQDYTFVSGNSGKCIKCSDGFYRSLNDQKCLQCSSPCKQCSGAQDSCLSCIPGYYLDNKACKKCDSSCLECDQSANQCTSCQPGYALNQGKCEKCDKNCLECINSTTFCTKCHEKSYLSLDKCVEQCPNKQYKNEQNRECMDCDLIKCKTCEGEKDKCSSCNDDLYLQEKQCVQSCSKGYELEINQCIKIKLNSSESEELAPGVIVGIVFGSLIVLLIIIMFFIAIQRSRVYKKIKQLDTKQASEGSNNQLQTNQDIETKNNFEDQNILNGQGSQKTVIKVIQ